MTFWLGDGDQIRHTRIPKSIVMNICQISEKQILEAEINEFSPSMFYCIEDKYLKERKLSFKMWILFCSWRKFTLPIIMENTTNSNHLRFPSSVFVAFMLFLASVLYTIIALQRYLDKWYRSVCDSLVPLLPIPAHPPAGSCSLSSPRWTKFLILLKGFA